MSTAEIIGVILAGFTLIGGLVSFVLSIIVGNNTRAMDGLKQITDHHASRLENHEGRIVKIETVHEVESR
jgi:hypothetical protein